jgi:DMSO/TMAO reductase YedYZ molybdopterin-dependent catalytic subunit
MTELNRRAAIQQVIALGAGLALVPDAAWSAALQLDGRELVPFEDVPANFSTKRTPPQGQTFTLPGEDAAGIDLRTIGAKTPPLETFIVSHYGNPAVDAAAWRLTIDGNAGRPLTLTLDELRKRPRVELTTMFECGGNREQIQNRLISAATWTGTPLKALLEDARPSRDVLEAIFWGTDEGEETIRNAKYQMNFARSMSIEDAQSAGAILAYEVEGQPLPAVHGFPVRLIVPGWYGVSNVKWLKRIELSPRRFMGRFMGRDYVTIMERKVGDRTEYTETSVTRMLVKSVIMRVTKPASGSGPLTVVGAAWGDGTPLQRVDVQVDGGAWLPAKLEPGRNQYAWTFWSLDIPALAAGSHRVASRATDRLGRTQPQELGAKKSNWENNAIWTRTIKV